MAEADGEVGRFGFRWGPMEVTRMARLPSGAVVARVKASDGPAIEVYVSEKGRRLRVFADGAEWKPVEKAGR